MSNSTLHYVDITALHEDIWLHLKAAVPQEPLSLDPRDPTEIGVCQP